MTREEAIAQIYGLKKYCEDMADSDESGSYVFDLDVQALDLALSALRPVSRERIAKMPRCEHCKDGKSFDGQVVIMGNKGMFPLNFCPLCGAPMTDEAVEMVMERLNKLEETKK